jgi:hypothetical protein
LAKEAIEKGHTPDTLNNAINQLYEKLSSQKSLTDRQHEIIDILSQQIASADITRSIYEKQGIPYNYTYGKLDRRKINRKVKKRVRLYNSIIHRKRALFQR